jgi:hypothetical protein
VTERQRAARARTAAADRLAAALGEPGCPVCRCLEADARRDLGAWLREQTMDPAGRAALRDAGGFCGWHTGLLREAADGILSVAILAEDLLGAAVAARKRCPACAGLRRQADEYLAGLLESTATARLAAGPGLPCRPHLAALRARARRDRRLPAVEAAVAPQLQRLRAALGRFIAKQDHRSATLPDAEEARAWREALEHLAGGPVVSGSDVASA